jgi:Na+-driven multidrug efflux pump
MLSLRNIGYQIGIGSSALLGEFTLAMLMFMGNISFMRYLSDDGVGAFGIACYYIPFVFMVGNAISQSAQPIISYNFGQQKMDRVHKLFRISLFTAVICGLTVTTTFIVYPDQLTMLFINPSSNSGQIVIHGFTNFCLQALIFFICNLSFIGYYQSIERVKQATMFALLRGILYLVPCFLILPHLFGNDGIWLAMPMSELLTFLTILMWKAFAR